ncbi:MAG: STAS/SEC14 domain-containing protein [Acidobacteriota bacterium]|jgi:hypothetical protein
MTQVATKSHAIALESRANGKALFVTLTGKLTKEDYEYFVPYIDERVEEQGSIDMLVELVDFHGWTVGAAWEDTKFGGKHFADIDRLAIIGDSKWEEGLALFCKPFTKAEVRYFERSDRSEAEAWILRAEEEEGETK